MTTMSRVGGHATGSDPALARSEILVESLQGAPPYPHPVTGIRLVETHISWILLTGDYAYKIKKPLDLGFLDFSTLGARRHACEEELRLNRRLAPDIYLGVVPIAGTAEQPRIDGRGAAFEYAVKMRQFPDAAMLDAELEARQLTPADLEQLAETIAEFHLSLSPAGSDSEYGTPEQIWWPVVENLRQLDPLRATPEYGARLERIEHWSEQRFAELRDLMTERKASGYVRECHGDLHIGNLVRLENGITGFDALEFDPVFRWTDVLCEVAFLVMDLEVRGFPNLAYRFLNRYLQVTGDYESLPLLNFYRVYRAMVRAKIAYISGRERWFSGQPVVDSDQAIDHLLSFAIDRLQADQPSLLLTMGLSGSGKTTVARLLADRWPAIHLRSDIERKRLFGIAELANSGADVDQGIYGSDASEQTYGRLAELAEIALQSGFNVICDAAGLRRAQRQILLDVAARSGRPVKILHCVADEETLKERIRGRVLAAADASEANIDVLEHQLQTQEALSPDELKLCVDIDTMGTVNSDELIADLTHR